MIRTLDVLSTKVAAIDEGSGAPVVLLHGNPDTKEIWQKTIERLAPVRRCIAPDLPGFGDSEIPAGHDFSLDAQARWVEATVTAAGVDEPVTLVVHDIGGTHGFAWAVKHPDRIARFVIGNTAFTSEFHWHFWARIWRTPVLGEISMAVMSYPFFARELRRGGIVDERELRASYERISPRSKRAVLGWYRAMDPEVLVGWSDALVEVVRKKGAAVRWGDRDPYVNKRFAESFGATDVRHFAEHGHWIVAERPDVFADAVLAGDVAR